MFFFEYWRESISILSIMLWAYGYYSYIIWTINWKNIPHIFSWWIWWFTTAIAFFAQISAGWWFGSAMLWFSAFLSFVIMFLAIRYGKNTIEKLDWYSLFLALFAIVLWLITDNPFYGAFFAMIADLLWFIPTFRKTWKNPTHEPMWYYHLSNIRHLLALFSLSEYNWTTLIFSGSIIITNSLLIFIHTLRKKK